MAAVTFCPVSLRELDECRADMLALTLFNDVRPLRGLLGLVDWRMRGALSRWVQSGFVSGDWGERVLVPSQGRLVFPRLLLLGLGSRQTYRPDRAAATAAATIEVAHGLGAPSLAVGLFGLPQLSSPFKRTGVELCEAFDRTALVDSVTIVADDEHRALIETYSELG